MIRLLGRRFPTRWAGPCLLTIVLAAAAAPALRADESPDPSSRTTVHVMANYHLESRDYVGYAGGFDVLAGVDFLIWRMMDLYAGPRIGWYSETVCTAYLAPQLAMHQKPSVGGQVYLTYPFRSFTALVSTAGVSVDVLLNFDELHSDPSERTYTFLGFFLGLRYLATPSLHLEARLEAGLFPFFEAIPILIKGGIRVGTAI